MRLKRKLVEKINPDSAHLCDASRDEIEEEASGKDQLNCLCICVSVYLRLPPGPNLIIYVSVYLRLPPGPNSRPIATTIGLRSIDTITLPQAPRFATENLAPNTKIRNVNSLSIKRFVTLLLPQPLAEAL